MTQASSPAGSWLRRDGNAALLAVGFLARLPLGMGAVLPLLLVLSRTGSATAAGSAVAAYGCGLCLAVPGWGRRADRQGAAPVLRTCAVGSLLATIALAVCPPKPVLLIVAAGLLGAFVPPTNAAMRALWTRRLPDEPARQAAAAAESVVAELVHIAGRIAVALLALVLPLGAVLVVAGGLLVAATEWLLRLRPPGPGLADRPPPDHRPTWTGALLVRLPLTYLALGLMSAGLGATSTGIALRADPTGAAAPAAALALALWGVGSAAGGLLAARRRPPVTLLLLGLGAGAALVGVGTWLPLGVAALLAGLPIAPALTGLYCQLQDRAPDGRVTEALALATSALFLGNAGGAAVAGVVATADGAVAAALAGVAFTVLAAASTATTPHLGGR